jgi:hypothetical protein
MNVKTLFFFLSFLMLASTCEQKNNGIKLGIFSTIENDIFHHADWALDQKPISISHYTSDRSAGGKNDFYSEGDYWWPDPDNPDGPYIQRDGLTNPDNFVAHRLAMIRLSKIVGYLASAYKLTGDKKYADHAIMHAEAWFVNPETKMNPSMLYAQAIKGRVTGRGIGIIDTIHLMEVAQGLRVMETDIQNKQVLNKTKEWFSAYLDWLFTHPYGKEEMQTKNNHATCWVMQVASFAKFSGNEEILDFCRNRYKEVILPDQMEKDGSFPRELARTKPYGYSAFNLDAMATICQILSDEENNLWVYKTEDGKSIGQGISFLFPYIKNKGDWPYAEDAMYWEEWPVAHPFLLFGGVALGNQEYIKTWQRLEHYPDNQEVVRNLPIRNPIIWLNLQE